MGHVLTVVELQSRVKLLMRVKLRIELILYDSSLSKVLLIIVSLPEHCFISNYFKLNYN
jgi:hypothetical protein